MVLPGWLTDLINDYEMCKIFSDGYKLKNGDELKVTGVHPDFLPEAVRNELEQAPASQLDILYVRSNLHRNAEHVISLESNIGTILEKIEGLEKTLDSNSKVVVKNSKEVERPIRELIAELWELLHDQREASVIKKIIKRRKKLFIVLFVLFLLFNLVFKQQAHQIVDFIAKNLLDILKFFF